MNHPSAGHASGLRLPGLGTLTLAFILQFPEALLFYYIQLSCCSNRHQNYL